MYFFRAIFTFLSVAACFLTAGLSHSYGQSTNSIEVIRPQDGLSNREVLCILQSRQGYMWFGTRNGLNRYDGNSILILNTRSKPVSLSDNEVLQLYEDSKGMIWIISGKTLDRLNPFDFTIRRYSADLHKAVREPTVQSIGETARGIWICTPSGKLMTMDTSGRFRLLFDFASDWPEEGPIRSGVGIDKKGTYWAVSGRYGVMKLSPEGRFIKNYHVKNKIISGPFIDSDNDLRICCSDGLFLYDSKRDSFIQTEKERSGSIFHYFQDSNGDIWLVENESLYKKEKAKWRRQVGLKEAIEEKEATLNALYEDQSHNIWIGTPYGVVKMPLRRNVFTTYLSSDATEAMAKRYSIRGVLEDDDGTIWIGSYGGFFHFNPETGKMETMPLYKLKGMPPMVQSPYASINQGDKIWMATEGYGLILFDKKRQTYQLSAHFRLPRSRGFPYFLISMAADSGGRFWIGSYEGLYFKDKGNDSFISYSQLYPGSHLDRGRIYAIYKGDANHMWVGTDKGLFRLEARNLKIEKQFASFADNGQPLSVRHITADRNGNLWIGTGDDGLYQTNAEGIVLRHWMAKDGMSDNTVYATLFDNGRLYCSTNSGITVIDTANKIFSRFYTEDGLSDNEFNHGSFLKHSSGEMYFGGIDGFNRFRPADLHNASKTSLPFVITSYEAYDMDAQSMRTHYEAVEGDLSLDLPYSNRSFAIHFALADYTRPDKNEYSYMLEGHDRDWVNLGNQSFIRMVGVQPGKYTLRIKALGSDGIWNEKELKVNITVAQIFYRTWWFISLSILLVAGGAFAFYTYRIRQYRKMLQMRTRIASDLHDEVGSHLTGIALSSDLMKQFPADERMGKLIDRISNSSRQASTKMSDVLWSIDSRSDTLDSLLNRMREHALEIFEPAGIAFSIETSGLPEKQKLLMNTRHNLYLIFKEATNNIVKHAKATKAIISLHYKTGRLEMTISDNGMAAPNPERKTGLGLRNMQMRANQMNGEIEIRNENGFRIHVVVKV